MPSHYLNQSWVIVTVWETSARQCEWKFGQASGKQAWASGILYRLYKTLPSSGEWQNFLVSQPVVNWTVRNKLQWIFNQNIELFIHKKVSENIVCDMAAILSRPQCVNEGSVLRNGFCQKQLSLALSYCPECYWGRGGFGDEWDLTYWSLRGILMWFWKYNFQSCFAYWYLYRFFIIMPLEECNWTLLTITLALVMAWCCQATSHYLNQRWRRSLMPYDVTRP